MSEILVVGVDLNLVFGLDKVVLLFFKGFDDCY
jgi:hypothetical protein